jgi:energy-coupling factor transport system permease protein
MVLGMIVTVPVWAVIILVATIGMLAMARIPAGTLKPYIRIAVMLSFLFGANLIVFGPKSGTLLFSIGWLQITTGNLTSAFVSILRLLILILSSILFMGILSESELVEGLRKLRIPYVVCFIFMMAIRFFPTLATDMAMIREAQMSRGTEFEKGSYLDKGRKFAAILIPLLVVSFRRVEVISTGLEARAFSAGLKTSRTYLRETIYRKRDIFISCISVTVVVAAIAYELLIRSFGFALVAFK